MERRGLLAATTVVISILLVTLLFLASQGLWNGTNDTPPDIIMHNGVILTMEQSPAQVEAVAIQGEYIIAVGDESDILAMAGSNTSVIDLEGRTLLPGFIDSHCHWFQDLSSSNISTPEEAIETALRSGWTSVSELYADQDRLSLLRSLDDEDSLRVRVNTYLPLSYQFERFGDWYQAYQPGQEFSSKLRIGGVKIFMDGNFRGYDHYFNQTELDSLVQEAHEAGFQIAIHSMIDNGTDFVLNSLESVLGGQSNHLYRHRIEHLVLLRDDQIQRMSDLGIIASFQLTWHNSDYPTYSMFDSIYNSPHPVARWRDILQAGIPAIGSTDFPWNSYDTHSTMKTISSAVTRIGELGLTPTAQMLNQTISVEQALRLLTIDAAYGTFQEDVKGSIKVGKFADLVMLSDNPLTVSEDNLTDIEVLMTMVGGVAEYTAPGQQFLTAAWVGASGQTIERSSQPIKMEMIDTPNQKKSGGPGEIRTHNIIGSLKHGCFPKGSTGTSR